MIYVLIIIIISIYFIFFFKNIGEGSSVNFRNKKLAAIIIIPLLLIIGIFFKNSGIINYVEYNSILDKHHEIRKNIQTIKKNIPMLRDRLQNEPSYYQGWVMLAKSYIIIDDLSNAAYAYEKALSLKNTDPIVLEEIISVLRRLDPKVNKEKILKYFNQLISLDASNLNVYNMKLNYSIDINDADLTKEILKSIVNNPKIKTKKQYLAALEQMEKSGMFDLKIRIEKSAYDSLVKYDYLYFILKEENSKVPFAVKKYKSNDLPSYLSINANSKMIRNSSIPKEVRLYVKGSDKPTVSDNMADIYRSNMLDLSKPIEHIIN